MTEFPINKLIERCVHYFQLHRYTDGTIAFYKRTWKSGILQFMSTEQQSVYSKTIGEIFFQTIHKSEVKPNKKRDIKRSIHVLNDMLEINTIRIMHFIPTEYPLYGNIGMQMELFITHLLNLRRKKGTLDEYRIHLNGFLNYLSDKGIDKVSDIKEYYVATFINSLIDQKRAYVITSLRGLFRFWIDSNMIQIDFDAIFSVYKFIKKEKLPSFYSAEEVHQVESSVLRASKMGKRNYAMILLATRLGLRASDIASFQLSAINWDKSIITLTMSKTDKIIELPLLADVGNALIDYLRYGRPNSNLKTVFIAGHAPYGSITSISVSSAISKIILQSGINTEGKRHGSHSMRHSLASILLKNGTTLPVISEVLGHSNTQTTMTYLKIDITSLMQCALPVSQVLDNFYNQKGGMFYE